MVVRYLVVENIDMFKSLFPAEEETIHRGHIGRWFVRTMDGGSLLLNDRSYKTIDIASAKPDLIYFDKEVVAVVAAWDYYNHHKENFPKDQQHRWHTLYGHNTSSVFVADATDDVESQVMDF